jgi:hypothetical protein
MIIPENQPMKSLKIASRRHFMRDLIVGASVYCSSPNLLAACLVTPEQSSSASPEKQEGDALMDQALEMLARTGPEYKGGLSNHGPMAAEALIRLGRHEAVIPWVERYKRNLQGPPDSRNLISKEDWREALGNISRVGDWIAFFTREMKEGSWRSVLSQWVPLLAPGLVAAATHGVIRTGHAVRSLAQRETEARRQELAQGLAYWAARYQLLPMSQKHKGTGLKPSQAIKQVETLPVKQRGRGLIPDSLRRLDQFPPFANVADLVDSSGASSQFISDLTETFAAVYLANARQFGDVIAFIHSVTGPSAIRLLLPYVKPEEARNLLRYGWQAAAGLFAAFGHAPVAGSLANRAQSKEELIDRAVATGDEHAIKFTEACLREYALNPKPVYLLAARHATDHLG